jgi:CxxC-x17-CxxC domain-containing protein
MLGENVEMTARVVRPTDDLQLMCAVCGHTFLFTADEQQFFIERGFQHPPKRCKKCIAKRFPGKSRVHTETHTQCANCGVATTVPFVPSQGRPVLCHSCFREGRRPAVTPC